MSRDGSQQCAEIVRLEPTPEQLELLQSLCQAGAPYRTIAETLRVNVGLLRIWEQRQDEAGDALRVARNIHELRSILNV